MQKNHGSCLSGTPCPEDRTHIRRGYRGPAAAVGLNTAGWKTTMVERAPSPRAHFARAFAPRSRLGLWVRNLVIQSLIIPSLARVAIGREISDRLPLRDYPFGLPSSVRARRSSDPG